MMLSESCARATLAVGRGGFCDVCVPQRSKQIESRWLTSSLRTEVDFWELAAVVHFWRGYLSSAKAGDQKEEDSFLYLPARQPRTSIDHAAPRFRVGRGGSIHMQQAAQPTHDATTDDPPALPRGGHL